MPLRLLSCSARRSFQPSVRTLRTSTIALAGHDHRESTKLSTPKPVSGNKGILEKLPSLRANDNSTYIGAGVGVLITILAVAFYTDLFGMNRLKKDSHSAQKKPAKVPAEIEKNPHPDQTKPAENASIEEEKLKPRSPLPTTQEISPLSESHVAELTTRVTEKRKN